MNKAIPPKWAERIWAVLRTNAGAGHSASANFGSFVQYLGEDIEFSHEYRFQGGLGFGGKFYADRNSWRVSCYREDETPARLFAIDRTNAALAALRTEYDREVKS